MSMLYDNSNNICPPNPVIITNLATTLSKLPQSLKLVFG
jgi:hypothetical protein